MIIKCTIAAALVVASLVSADLAQPAFAATSSTTSTTFGNPH